MSPASRALSRSPAIDGLRPASRPRPAWVPSFASGFALFTLYALSARVGIIREFPTASIGVLWLPLGLLLGWLLRSPRREWPALLVIGLLGDWLGEGPQSGFVSVFQMFTEDALQVVLGAILVTQWSRERPLSDIRGTLAIVFGGAVVPAFLFAFLKVGRRVYFGVAADAMDEWWCFFLSNVLSVLALAPFVLFVSLETTRDWSKPRAARLIEASALLVGLTAAGLLVLLPGLRRVSHFITTAAASLPFAAWAAVRFGPAGVGGSVLALTMLGCYGVPGDVGPFALGTSTEGILATEIFLIVLAVSMLLLSAALIERQTALVEAHDNAERLRSVVEHQTELVCRYLPDTTLTFVNDAYCRYVGRSAQELLGAQWIDFVPAPDRARMLGAVQQLCVDRKPATSTHRVEQRDGRMLSTQWVDVVVPAEDGTVRELQGIGRDVTALTHTHEALRRSEERLKRAMEAADLGDWEIDLATGSVWWSNALSEIVGRSPSEFGDVQSAILSVIHPDDRAQLETQLANIAQGHANRVEFRLVRPDGSIRWIEGAGDAVRDQGTAARWIVGVSADVTQRKLDDQALRDALDEVRRLKDRLQDENAVLIEELASAGRFGGLVFVSPAMKDVLARAERVAPTETAVLIMGETGTGKELLARAIHERSLRKSRPLVAVNCAALPESLFETELFGHEKGAFTGAATRRAGRFEVADHGTIFLDEIGELPLELQAKLLRVLQDGEFERLGSSRTQSTDARLIAATNRDLSRAVREGRFRSDLYYRLNVFPIHMPTLRDRPEDIPSLAAHFLDLAARRLGRRFDAIGGTTLTALQRYRWPGNVRELQNVIERAALLSSDGTLTMPEGWDVPGPTRVAPPSAPADSDALLKDLAPESRTPTLEELERTYILQVLERTRWRIEGPRGAAIVLGMNPSTLRSRVAKLGILTTRGQPRV